MTRLEELLISFSTIVLRYHDAQGINTVIKETDPILLLIKSRERAALILQNKDGPFEKKLDDLTKECTARHSDRRTFLLYVVNEITYLKNMFDRKNSLSPTKLAEFKQQMAQMFIDLRQLLKTPSDGSYTVKYSVICSEDESMPVKGISVGSLMNNAHFGNLLRKSGSLLTEEVFNRFNITTTSTDKELAALAGNICTEFQNTLLAPELQEEVSKLIALTERQKTTIESQAPALIEAEKKSREQTASIELLTTKLAEADNRSSEQAANIKSLTTKLAEADTRISEQAVSIRSLTTKLATADTRTSEQAISIKSLKSQLEVLESRIRELLATNKKQEETISDLRKGPAKALPMGLSYGPLFGFHHSLAVPRAREPQHKDPASEPTYFQGM